MRVNTRLEINVSINVQQPIAIKPWSSYSARPILRDSHSRSLPGAMSIAVGAIPRGARRNRRSLKHTLEVLYSFADRAELQFRREVTRLRWTFRIPVLVSNPRHAPKYVGSLRLP